MTVTRAMDWDDLLYQIGVEIDIAEAGELEWTSQQLAAARRYENDVRAWSGK
jgi:hypothetical protein